MIFQQGVVYLGGVDRVTMHVLLLMKTHHQCGESKKIAYFGHRRFLPIKRHWRSNFEFNGKT